MLIYANVQKRENIFEKVCNIQQKILSILQVMSILTKSLHKLSMVLHKKTKHKVYYIIKIRLYNFPLYKRYTIENIVAYAGLPDRKFEFADL